MLENLIYILLFGFTYKSKLIQNFLKAKRNKSLLKKYYFIKKNIIKEIYNDKTLDDSIIINNFNHSKNFKQFIISKLLLHKFFNAILLNSIINDKPLIFPLPTSSLLIIKKKIKVSFYFSKLVWILLCFLFFFRSIHSFFCIFFSSQILNYDSNYTKIYLDSIPTIDLNKNNLFYFIINKLNLKKKKIIFFHCNKTINDKKYRYNYNLFKTFYVKSITQIFLNKIGNFHCLKIFLKIIISLFFRKNFLYYLIFFQEILDYSLIQKSKYTFNHCFFNNPRIVFKPSWAEYNEIQLKNSVIFYFYSINIFPLITNQFQKYYDLGGYLCSSWNIFWVWNKNQLNWLKSQIHKKFSFKFVNFVPFEGLDKNIKINQNKKIVTIFDVPPKNLFTISQLVNPYNHYNFNYCKTFLEDIVYNPLLKNFIICVKIKRDYSGMDPRYRKLIKKIKQKDNVKIFYNETSVISLIKRSNFIISMPFTSTALIAKYFKKNSIYYNPYLHIKKSKFYPEGVKVITKKNALNLWLKNNNVQ